MENGALVISLDFELFWGVRDKRNLSDNKELLLGARKAVKEMLKLFEKYNVSVTWSTVGFLFFSEKKDLLNNIPEDKPEYEDRKLSPYNDLDLLGNDESDDPYHFAYSLIKLIQSYENQRIGTHTFSHYYCLESGQNEYTFAEDIEKAVLIAKQEEIKIDSLVFPRNQYNDEYLSVLEKFGISSFRGNPQHKIYKARSSENGKKIHRIYRLIDTYINITGNHSYKLNHKNNNLVNIPASRFLRPYSKRFKLFENLKIKRIKNELSYAAKNKQIYHLWWHPHNFGVNLDENLKNLEGILMHYQSLNERSGFESLNMEELSTRVIGGKLNESK